MLQGLACGNKKKHVPSALIIKDTHLYIDRRYMPDGFTYLDPHNLRKQDALSWLQHLAGRQSKDRTDAFQWSHFASSNGRIPAIYAMSKAPRDTVIPIPISEKARTKEGKSTSDYTVSSVATTPAPSEPSSPASSLLDLSPLTEDNDSEDVEAPIATKKTKKKSKGKGKARASVKELRKRNHRSSNEGGSSERTDSDQDEEDFIFNSSESDTNQTPLVAKLARQNQAPPASTSTNVQTATDTSSSRLFEQTPSPSPTPASQAGRLTDQTPGGRPSGVKISIPAVHHVSTPVTIGLLRYVPSPQSSKTPVAQFQNQFPATPPSLLTSHRPPTGIVGPTAKATTPLRPSQATDEMLKRAAIGKPPSWTGVNNKRRHFWLQGVLSEADFQACVSLLNLKVSSPF